MKTNVIESPYELRGRAVKNRIIRSATNDHLGNPDGTVSEAEIDMYETLAANNIGIIITGHLSVSPDLALRADEMQLCIGDDCYIPGLSHISETIKRGGSLAIAQLSLAGPRGLNPFDFNSLSTEEMTEIRDMFVKAAVRAKKAGFDGVQIHLAHWYLLQAVLDPGLNKRTDRYGGSPENRVRLPQEIIRGVAEECGEDFIIMVKVNSNYSDDKEDHLALLAYYCGLLSESGASLIEISGTDFTKKSRQDSLYYLEAAKYLRSHFPEMTLSLVGGIYSRETIERALQTTDFASLSRALLTQPDFITRMMRDETEVSRCLHCNKCFEIFSTKYERCVFGPVIRQLEETFGHNQ